MCVCVCVCVCVWPLSPEEVLPAVNLALAEEALLRQVGLAVAALHALGVPLPVQKVQQEAVQDGPLASGTLRHGGRGYSGDALTPVVTQPGGQGVQRTHLVGRQVHGVGGSRRRPTTTPRTVATSDELVSKEGVDWVERGQGAFSGALAEE